MYLILNKINYFLYIIKINGLIYLINLIKKKHGKKLAGNNKNEIEI